ncbi:MAG: DEAD/DEAH box helicase family protein [Aquificaceae bacterium]|nr:DEAD/DEAH box helicase family protein [Aquificaceae bacterium]
MKTLLQNMLRDIDFQSLPSEWANIADLERFSYRKSLWDYQQEALKNAIKMLWKYYEDLRADKQELYRWYVENGLTQNLDISLEGRRATINKLLTAHFEAIDGKIPFYHYINRMNFWMATGSGKTLIIIKLIEILRNLMEKGLIPQRNILFLTHRDDLIEQFKRHFTEFNQFTDKPISIRELKEYPKEKRFPDIFGKPVFYYRADNIGDSQKEKIIDFRNYLEDGKWYLILDEAHKGDKEESKRQHIYSILAKNGFLFNFSATFTEPRDILTTGYEYNLSSFVSDGYGKQVLLLEQDLKAFRDREDFDNSAKQKAVLKALLLLTYTKLFYEKVKAVDKKLYHNPLLMVLVNSVSERESDLELFFREMVRIGKGEPEEELLQKAKQELIEELSSSPEYVYGGESFSLNRDFMESIGYEEILLYVYNAQKPGNVEVSYRPSNKKEVLFKLKSADTYFALSKTGEMPRWLEEELKKLEVNHQFEEESFFERLNHIDSPVNILIGSRSFYEGWDSNRPNIICFINIGTRENAKKFVLQSIGRGIRVQPIENQRKRLLSLYNNKQVDIELYEEIKEYVKPLETLFVLGTNKEALRIVVEELKKEKRGENIELSKNQNLENHKLLIPVYKKSAQPLWEQRKGAKFTLHPDDLKLLENYVNYMQDDRILLFTYKTEPKTLQIFRKTFDNIGEYYREDEKAKKFKDIDFMVTQVLNYLSVIPEEFCRFKQLSKEEEEIKHFKKIAVYIEDLQKLKELKEKIEIMKDYPQKLSKNQKEAEKAKTFEHENSKLHIKYIAEHYYLPVLVSDEEKKVEYISNIIKVRSEIEFINQLENYLQEQNNKFKDFDWWFFSKLDEKYDEVYIPYYDPQTNSIRKFKPDFIFWLCRGKDYFIVFVDPKSSTHTSYEYKVDGYRVLFEESNQPKKFEHEGYIVRVFLFLKTEDENRLSELYRKYWFDSIDQMLGRILP